MCSQEIVLAIDTAQAGCGVGLMSADHAVFAGRFEPMERGQSERLLPMLDTLLTQEGGSYQDLRAVVCNNGPGAFNGLRIGLSTARAIGLALDIPVWGVTSFQAFAYGQGDDICVILETKRQDFYVWMQTAIDAQAMSARALQELLERQSPRSVVTDCAARLKAGIDLPAGVSVVEKVSADPLHVASLYFEAKGILDAPNPYYLRGADVSASKKPQRKLQV